MSKGVSKYKLPEKFVPGMVLRERGSLYGTGKERKITLKVVSTDGKSWEAQSHGVGRPRMVRIKVTTLRDKWAL